MILAGCKIKLLEWLHGKSGKDLLSESYDIYIYIYIYCNNGLHSDNSCRGSYLHLGSILDVLKNQFFKHRIKIRLFAVNPFHVAVTDEFHIAATTEAERQIDAIKAFFIFPVIEIMRFAVVLNAR